MNLKYNFELNVIIPYWKKMLFVSVKQHIYKISLWILVVVDKRGSFQYIKTVKLTRMT